MKIDKVIYFIALLSLMIGIPIELETAYSMLEGYDPFGLGFIIPALCIAGLFRGLWIAGSEVSEDLKTFTMWLVLVVFTLFSIASLRHSLNESLSSNIPFLVGYHLLMPMLLWGFQALIWTKAKKNDNAEDI